MLPRPEITGSIKARGERQYKGEEYISISDFHIHSAVRLKLSQYLNMTSTIRTVGVVGTGVIGASWTALFLSHGLKVLVSDPAPGAEDRLFAYLHESWPTLKGLGLHEDASISNCTFVGESLDDYCSEVDFIQEVCIT